MAPCGQLSSATGRVVVPGTNSAPVEVISSATFGASAYVTRCLRATSSRITARPGRTWLTRGLPIIAIWRRDMEGCSFQCYGMPTETPRLRTAVEGAPGAEGREREERTGGAAARVSRRSGENACPGHVATPATAEKRRASEPPARSRAGAPGAAACRSSDRFRRYRPPGGHPAVIRRGTWGVPLSRSSIPHCPCSCGEGDGGGSGFVEGAVAEHGEQDADALAGESEEAGWAFMQAKAERNMTRLSCRLLPRGVCSPGIEVPDCFVVGARPA